MSNLQFCVIWWQGRRIWIECHYQRWSAMMHVMQPVVLDGGGWPTTHAPPTNSPSAPTCAALLGRSTVNASLNGSAVHEANILDSQTQNISMASSFKTPHQADMCGSQPRAVDTSVVASANHLPMTSSVNPSKPPKKPLTPYLRFSQKVSCGF